MFFDSCQKELKKMKLYLPGNCLIFISLNADPLRAVGEGRICPDTVTHVPKENPCAAIPQCLGHAAHMVDIQYLLINKNECISPHDLGKPVNCPSLQFSAL